MNYNLPNRVIGFLVVSIMVICCSCSSGDEQTPEEVIQSDLESSDEVEGDGAQPNIEDIEPKDDTNEVESFSTDESILDAISEENSSTQGSEPAADTFETQTQLTSSTSDSKPNKSVVPSINSNQSSPKKRVWFVKNPSTPVYKEPNDSLPPISFFQKGDHFLLQIDSDWVEVYSNAYIRSEHLTTAPIGRTIKKRVWKLPSH